MAKKQQIGRSAAGAPSNVGYAATRDVLIRSGLEVLTEQGFASTGLDALLRRATVPKGSFYHYFKSKAAYGRAVIAEYDAFFRHKLDRTLKNDASSPLARLEAFVADAKAGMAKYGYARGCLVGNLAQEVEALPDDYRAILDTVIVGWQSRVEECLVAARHGGEIGEDADCKALAEYFWIGWEGAVLRARLVKNGRPLDVFIGGFLSNLASTTNSAPSRKKKL